MLNKYTWNASPWQGINQEYVAKDIPQGLSHEGTKARRISDRAGRKYMILPPQWNKAAKAFHGAGREQKVFGTDCTDYTD